MTLQGSSDILYSVSKILNFQRDIERWESFQNTDRIYGKQRNRRFLSDGAACRLKIHLV